MKEIIDSLSLGSGALVVAILSAIIAVGANRIIKTKKIKWLASLTVPFLIANLIYWSPAMFGADSSEYGTWAPLFIIPWYTAGALASALLVFITNRKTNQ